MENKYIEKLGELLTGEATLGLVGVGALGTELRTIAEKTGHRVILCDPPRNLEEATELGESFFGLWGNGMGGCNLSNEGLEVFVPLSALGRADVISIQVPLTDTGRFPTEGMITREFLDQCRPNVKILCFSAQEVIAEDARDDSRIIFF